MIKLLRRPKVVWFLAGVTLSAVGGGIAAVALPLTVLRATHSTVFLGLVFVVRQVPITVLSLLIGQYIDAWGPRRAALTGLILGSCAGISIPFFVHVPGLILVSSFVIGVSWIFLYPLQSMYLPRLVSDGELEAGNALFRTVLITASLGGNALGGGFATLGWYRPAFWGSAAMEVGGAATIVIIGGLGWS